MINSVSIEPGRSDSWSIGKSALVHLGIGLALALSIDKYIFNSLREYGEHLSSFKKDSIEKSQLNYVFYTLTTSAIVVLGLQTVLEEKRPSKLMFVALTILSVATRLFLVFYANRSQTNTVPGQPISSEVD